MCNTGRWSRCWRFDFEVLAKKSELFENQKTIKIKYQAMELQ
jgi:hypothetical protein